MEDCLRLDHAGRERGSNLSNVREAVQVLHNMETAKGSKCHWSEELTHSGGPGLCDWTCLAILHCQLQVDV